MPALFAYSNVENTALAIIRAKGFQIWHNKDQDLLCAEKDGWDFMATGAVELLGLIAIYEHHKPKNYTEYWWKIDGNDLFRELATQPQPYTPVFEKD